MSNPLKLLAVGFIQNNSVVPLFAGTRIEGAAGRPVEKYLIELVETIDAASFVLVRTDSWRAGSVELVYAYCIPAWFRGLRTRKKQ